MAQLHHHPAPGLGDLLPGFYVVPQNPIYGATTYVPRIGDILPGSYPVPQNPIKDYMAGKIHQIGREPGAPGTVNGKTVSCGGIGDCGCSSCKGGGMGDISADISNLGTMISSGNITGALQAPIMGVPTWGVLAGVVVVFALLGGHEKYTGRRRK